jgi:glutamate-1-semialdehyde 2,1-aminomutase
VRSFKAVGGDPRVIAGASGATLIEVDGSVLIDCIGAWGSAILGHAHPGITERIAAAAAMGTSFGTCAPGEVALAEAVIERMPAIERLRFTNSGTEAALTALRLARAATGRSLIIKFDGCYHGHGDALLVRAGSGSASLGVPDSAGVPAHTAGSTLVASYNDLGSVQEILAEHGDRVAALLVEPVAGNMGLVPPCAGFLEGLRRAADRWGALLIFDEVMTGFRIARGGASERYGVRPDLTLLGKILGGGLPVGAVGGPAALMDLLAPDGPVYSAGTFSGNPLTMAAGLATLDRLDGAAYEWLERAAARLERGLRVGLEAGSILGCVQRVGSMLSLFLGPPQVRSMDDARGCDAEAFARFFHGMLARGVHLPPSAFESWFISLAHGDVVIDSIVCAAQSALLELHPTAHGHATQRSPAVSATAH